MTHLRRHRTLARGGAISLALAAAAHGAPAQTLAAGSLADLTLEQLANIEITSVTGRPERAQDAAASVFVITADDIRRSAATSLPEAQRLGPNLQVARLNAGQYAISARGFNNAIGNKLLVLIDGRTVYSPLFSGVFWDAEDVVLADIERIEVISGPGATLWGANAVNGVINVITRSADETQGAYALARGGREGGEATAQFGGALGDAGHYRAYATRLHRDNTELVSGVQRADTSSKNQVGFRTDWKLASDRISLQGDAYHAGSSSASNLSPVLAGQNLVARWNRQLADGANWQLQAYYDHSSRADDVLFRVKTTTWDIEFNHVPVVSADHKLIWGAGYRRSRSEADPTRVLFDPAVRTLQWSNVFAQDEIRVAEPLRVTVGAKLETNVYTGLEVLPTLRAAYKPGEAHTIWASASRAVRAPARVDRDFFIGTAPPFLIKGGPDFDSEVANVYELGYRAQPTAATGFSITAFHHDYRKLRGGTPAPTFIENRVSGPVEGVETWGSVDATSFWRLSAGWTELRKSLRAAPGSSATTATDLGNDPKRQWQVRSRLALPRGVDFDVAVRHVASLPAPVVAGYTATDLCLAWQATRRLTLSVQVQNAFDPNHVEFNAVNAASQIPRATFVALEYRPN